MFKIKYDELAKTLLKGESLTCKSCKYLEKSKYKMRHKIRSKRKLKYKYVCNQHGYTTDVNIDQWCEKHEVRK